MIRHILFSILLLSATLPVLAQKGTTPPPSSAPTPVRGVYDPMQDPRKNGMADSGPASAATAQKAGETVSVTTLAAPPEARAAYDKGIRAYNKQKWPEAQKNLQKAVEIYPQFAAAWYSLGVCLGSQNKPGDAVAAYRRSIDADPKFPEPYVQLAAVEINDSKWEEAADVSGKVILLDPQHFPEAYLYNSVANLQLLKFDAAERSAREAIRTDTDHKYPKAEQMLGLALANEKDYVGAKSHLTAYLALEKNPTELALARKQLAVIEQAAADAGR